MRSPFLIPRASCDARQHATVRTVINSREALSRPCYRAAVLMAPPGGTVGFDDDPDEDTVEMVLTPADLLLLERAAEEPQPAARLPEETPPHAPTTIDSVLPSMPSQTSSPHKSANLTRGALAGVAGALVIVVAVASLSTARLSATAKSSPAPVTTKLVAAAAPATTTPTPTVEPPQPAAAPDPQPLRYKNPFDKSEVFEFPAGTTREEARQSVAELLMQRAHDRHVRPGLQHSRINGALPRRSAKQADLVQVPTSG